MLDRQSHLVETKTKQFLNSVSLPALRGPLLWGSSERRMWTTGRTGPCPEMDAAWRQVAVQTWLAGNTWLNRNIRYLTNTTGFTKCDSWLSWGWSPMKGWQRDSSWLITFWSASLTLPRSSQRWMCPLAQGNATREALLPLSLLWSCLSEASGDQTWNCWRCQPQDKICEAQPGLFMPNLIMSLGYSHLELPMVCCNCCLILRVGDLGGTYWWMLVSF